MNLYQITMSGNAGGVFFVVANTESQAARLAEAKWVDWKYFRAEGTAVATKLIASNVQYPAKGVAWLLIAAPEVAETSQDRTKP
jgi:hypothetical protein